MRKNTWIALTMGLCLLVSGPALAGSDEMVNLGTVEMSRGDLDRLRHLVAGEPVPAAEAAAVETTVNVGVVELAQSDLERIQALMAGAESAPVLVAAGEEMVNLGRVAMSRSEFEALKMQVSDHLGEVRDHLARISPR
ncbi:MAG: hypothetical protein RBR20_03050 [Desulfobacterales bacterium]|nr:hypothetical protein [Desulfobacteraceae bacterium]MDY0311079.1 hypothetical protein [Desulfobacterales bacterium]